MNDSDPIEVATTTGDRGLAERIATELVDRRLAACVQIAGPLTSTYRWQGKIERQEEWRVVIKTVGSQLPRIQLLLDELHPYDLPELVATAIVGGNPAYLDWLAAESASGGA